MAQNPPVMLPEMLRRRVLVGFFFVVTVSYVCKVGELSGADGENLIARDLSSGLFPPAVEYHLSYPQVQTLRYHGIATISSCNSFCGIERCPSLISVFPMAC